MSTADGNQSNYLVVSADCHAGADVADYRPYLDSEWHDEFDAWSAGYRDGWIDMDSNDQKLGIASAGSYLNWDSDRRLAELDADGVVGEVIFPNTSPPFYPSGALTAPAPRTKDEYARRFAGLQAHNRWLADFCNELPGRRAGVIQVFLNDVDDAIAEIERARNDGLTGGVLLPTVEPNSGIPGLYSRDYDRLWAACQSFDIPVNHHSTIIGLPSEPGESVGRNATMIYEFQFFSQRGLWHLMFGGVFERYPELKFVLTEQFAGWIPERLATLDMFAQGALMPDSPSGQMVGPAIEQLSMLPSEYFRRNCYVGASFMLPSEIGVRDDIGVDHIMWGSDFPHSEGSYPWSREALRATFSDVPVHECRQMLGDTAAALYGLDLAKLREAADLLGPSPAEVAVPLSDGPVFPRDTKCFAFGEAPAGA